MVCRKKTNNKLIKEANKSIPVKTWNVRKALEMSEFSFLRTKKSDIGTLRDYVECENRWLKI